MSIQPINSTQTPKRRNANVMLSTAAGAAAGALARHVVPTKDELSNIFNKETADKFVSSARAQNRSILKYTGIGAFVAAGISILRNMFKQKETSDSDLFQYSKYAALIDAPDYAVEVMYYGE